MVLLTDGASETVKHETKKSKSWTKSENLKSLNLKCEAESLGSIMVPMATSLVASMTSPLIKPVASSLINALAKKESWE